ncbi:unnamed protein product [Meganyctiphanes norvegica]|uniref:NAD(P)-binding domain-containing protein n=1 Tax=Meganyctiphanes norvegica TaxID=48144 RepID=A0AAV2PSX8_MEGNR
MSGDGTSLRREAWTAVASLETEAVTTDNMATKIVIFGATGNAGLAAVEQAVKLNLSVTAFVRDPAKLPAELSSKVKVHTGDSLNRGDVEAAVKGQDAVVVVLGTHNDLKPQATMSGSLVNILMSMKKLGVKRISCCASAMNFTERSEFAAGKYKIMINVYDDHNRMLELLEHSTSEWVAVLPGHINKNNQVGCTVAHGKQPGMGVNKHDLGHFMVTCFNNQENIKKRCGIADKA